MQLEASGGVLVAPSILSADFANLANDVRLVAGAGADLIHVDVMDGHFVPNITIGPGVVSALRRVTDVPLDVHLMVSNPAEQVPWFLEAGASIVTFHLEAAPHANRIVQTIHSAGAKAGVAINPSTPVAMLEDLVDIVDLVLVMSVNPGFGGQSFLPGSAKKVRQVRELAMARAQARGAAPARLSSRSTAASPPRPRLLFANRGRGCWWPGLPSFAQKTLRPPSARSAPPQRRFADERGEGTGDRMELTRNVGGRVYLDHAATTPMAPEVLEAMHEAAKAAWANPSSLHTEGREAFKLLEDSRGRIARALGARHASEIVFTSGGTESDNAALIGITSQLAAANTGKKAHVIVSAFEHAAVLETAKRLKATGTEVTYLAPRPDGFCWPEDLGAAMRENTVLVSIMAANNEVGTVQPIDALAAVAHRAGALFHTDAVQMLGKLPIALEASGVDAASFSAHKIAGPRGKGILYLRSGTPFMPLLRGGGQEAGRRSGTQDGIATLGMAVAVEAANGYAHRNARHERRLRDRLLQGLLAASDRVAPVCDFNAHGPASDAGDPLAGLGMRTPAEHLPGIVAVTVDGMESETLLMRLDALDVAASGGSACSSGSLGPSHVLTALGVPRRRALGLVRFSLGRTTTEHDIDWATTAFAKAVRG